MEKRKKRITQVIDTREINLNSDPNGAWNTSTFVPLAQVKLLVSEALREHGNRLSQETLDMLRETLEKKEKV